MKDTRYPIAERVLLNEDNLYLTLYAPEIAQTVKPGQFVNVLGKKFLRRPFGIARVQRTEGLIALGIKAKGCGTREFFSYEVGDYLDVLGPLGHGFQLQGLDVAYIIGGGTGIYPLLFLLDACKEKGIKTYIATGFRTAAEALLLDTFREHADAFMWASERVDDSEPLAADQLQGYAQVALETLFLKYGKTTATQMLTCGPIPMMQRAAAWAKQKGIAAQVSMEERMACGFGICRTCAVELAACAVNEKNLNYARCCVEGPVFEAEAIAWPSI